MMMLDTRIAQAHADPSLGVRKNCYSPRVLAPVAIIVHTTGDGPIRRFQDPKECKQCGYKTPCDAARRLYRELMKPGPHYVIGQGGEIYQTCPENLCAWHVGGEGGGHYLKATWCTPQTRWWTERWPDLTSPRDLAGYMLWTGYVNKPQRLSTKLKSLAGSVNANSIGIEVVPPIDHGPWTEQAWRSLLMLVKDISQRHPTIPLRRHNILSHSDAHPLQRSARNQPWDPGTTQWTWEAFAQRATLAGLLA